MSDARAIMSEPMIGTVKTARGAMRPPIIMFTFMMIFGIGMTIFGALGGPDFFDHSVPAADRERFLSAFRPVGMGGGLVMLALGTFGRFALSSAVKGIDRSEPKGDARLSPIAWMMHISRLGQASWRGPYEGRTVSLRRFTTRNRGSTTAFTIEVKAHTRVAWMRRPKIGERIDRAAGMESENGEPFGFPKLDVSMAERPWATRLFEVEGVREAVSMLTNEEPLVLVIVRPGKLVAQYPGGPAKTLDEASLIARLAALTVIAKAIESSPEPAQRLEPNAIERFADKYS